MKLIRMKEMKCKHLSGLCTEVFRANTFEVIAELCKQHGFRMLHSYDRDHTEAMIVCGE